MDLVIDILMRLLLKLVWCCAYLSVCVLKVFHWLFFPVYKWFVEFMTADRLRPTDAADDGPSQT